MPDLSWNGNTWDGAYDWSQGGEEWSWAWGGSEAQWFGSIYPRVHRFLPARSILEIAPGFGRWTRFLVSQSETFIGVDLSAECVAACQRAFAGASHASFVKNDGTDLSMVPDASVDLVFSFDSLVHVEMDVLGVYLDAIVKKLRKGGVAFLHHSNSKEVTGGDPLHNRAISVGRGGVKERVEAAGGVVLVQETINWGGAPCIDCITTLARAEDFPQRESIVFENPRFMLEAELIREHLAQYCRVTGS